MKKEYNGCQLLGFIEKLCRIGVIKKYILSDISQTSVRGIS